MIDKNIYEKEINRRLIRVLNDPELYSLCLKAYIQSNKRTGFERPEEAAEITLNKLAEDLPLLEKEKTVWESLGNKIVKGKPLNEYIHTIIKNRIQTMYSQIGDYILDVGKGADFGSGLGDFLRLVKSNKPNLQVEGWDVVNDDVQNDVHIYDGKRIPREDGYYDQVWETTVLHHLNNPMDGIKEMSRLSNKRIIILETLPLGWLDNKEKDLDVTFVADYYYRLLLKSNEPVPGSYHTKDEWLGLFEKEGWKCVNSEVFGSDIDFAEFNHVRIVFEK